MRIKLTLVALFVLLRAFGAPVDEQEARMQVAKFLNARYKSGLRKAPAKTDVLQKAFAGKVCYVYNVGSSQGFVIASADDAVQPILGYAAQGSFDAARIPDGMQAWMEQMEREMALLRRRPELKAFTAPARTSIAPLLQTTWDQDAPYNLNCPTFSGQNTYTGCVATALAQIMFYHKYPTTIPAQAAYTTTTKNISVNALPKLTVDYANMPLDGRNATTAVQKTALANLMRYCGQALNMDYTTNYSGTTATAEQLINKFNFDPGLRKIFRTEHTTAEWDSIIYTELAARRPVLMDAFNFTGGHSFVIDGYDGAGKYHVNWGWGGTSNGYFVLHILNPEDAGIGGTALEDGYTLGQDIFVGLQRKLPNSPTPKGKLLLESFSVGRESFSETKVYTRSSPSGSFSVDFWSEWANKNSVDVYAYSAYFNFYQDGVIKNNPLLSRLLYKTLPAATGSTYETAQANRTLDVSLPDGTYDLLCEYRDVEDGPMIRPIDCEKYMLKAVVSGNTMTISPPANIDKGLKINSVQINGKPYLNEIQEIRVNATNEGLQTYPTLYARVNGEAATGVGVAIDPGTTGEVLMHVRANNLRTNTLELCADIRGEKVLYTTTFQIYEEPEANLSGVMTFPDYVLGSDRPKMIAAPTLKTRLTLSNRNAVPYDGTVQLVLYKAEYNADGKLTALNSQSYVKRAVKIDANGTQTVELENTDVLTSGVYRVQWKYTSKGLLKDGESSALYQMVTSPFSAGGVNYRITGDHTAEVTYRAAAAGAPSGYSGTVTIPVAVADAWGRTYHVTSVGEQAFARAADLRAVVLPNSVRTLGDRAFDGTEGIEIFALRPEAPQTGTAVFSTANHVLRLPAQHSGYEAWGQTAGSALTVQQYSDRQANAFPGDAQPYEHRIERRMQRGFWNTMTLPFDILPEDLALYFGQGTKVAVLDPAATTEDVRFRTTTAVLRAGTPFIVKPAAEGQTISSTSIAAVLPAEQSAAPVQSTDASWSFVPLLSPTAIESGRDCFLGAGNKYYVAVGSTPEELTVYGFRAYLRPALPLTGSKQGTAYFVDDEPVATELALPTAAQEPESMIYDLQGRAVGRNLSLLPKGLYIVNGKKMVKP